MYSERGCHYVGNPFFLSHIYPVYVTKSVTIYPCFVTNICHYFDLLAFVYVEKSIL